MTAQFVGEDGVWFTDDDVNEADLNVQPAFVSVDLGLATGERNSADHVRPFVSMHPGGGVFSHADGSTHFVSDDIDRSAYISRSHIRLGRTGQ